MVTRKDVLKPLADLFKELGTQRHQNPPKKHPRTNGGVSHYKSREETSFGAFFIILVREYESGLSL